MNVVTTGRTENKKVVNMKIAQLVIRPEEQRFF